MKSIGSIEKNDISDFQSFTGVKESEDENVDYEIIPIIDEHLKQLETIGSNLKRQFLKPAHNFIRQLFSWVKNPFATQASQCSKLAKQRDRPLSETFII